MARTLPAFHFRVHFRALPVVGLLKAAVRHLLPPPRLRWTLCAAMLQRGM